MKRIAFYTLGCKVNQADTASMEAIFRKAGYQIVGFNEQADIYLINTCVVTNMGQRKSRQIINRAVRSNPLALTVVTGCYPQTAPDEVKNIAGVDVIIGNQERGRIVELAEQALAAKQDEVLDNVHKITVDTQFEELAAGTETDKTRAFLKIQEGCNQYCTYCIIPYARGPLRSRSLDSIREEVGKLVAAGYKEVVLTGIHLSSYGIDTGESLLELIQKVHEIDGIKRIRLGSLEPRIITEEFASSIAILPKMCPHFHLSLQSGCNGTLKRMNRRYSAEEYMEKCDLLRKYFHNPALTTDVIVGFPGETQEEFAESMDFVDRVNFYETHIFKYSRRAGTKAAVMPDQIPEEIKSERSAKMIELGHRKQKAYEERLLGTTQEVLMEEAVETEDGIYQVGHTKEYVKIGLKTEENLSNQLKNVKIEDTKQIIH